MLEDPSTLYKVILVSFIMPILLAGILIWFFISYQRKKYQNEVDKKDALLREQALVIEKQQAIENERSRIASEMHDDLGSGLTTIRYLSDKALLQAKDPDEASQISRIAEHSNTLVRNMSEIIWAMNARFDNTENLTGYLRRYASEYLDEHQMKFHFQTSETEENTTIGGEKRRNIFLVFKEILHNSVKYAKSESIHIHVNATNDFVIRISEVNAVGFDPELSLQQGNGLFNCRKRMQLIGGNIAFERTGQDMHITISAPITADTHA